MSQPPAAANVCVVTGSLVHPPEVRTLASGELVANLEVRVLAGDDPPQVVPVACPRPDPAVVALPAGSAVVVRGRVRRRFFRSAGRTQSRTEVLADAVVPARQRARVRRLLAEVAEALRAP